MKKYNEKLLKATYAICERDNSITEVGPKYYQDFLNIPEKGMEILIQCIITDRVESINRNILSNEWKNDEEIFEYITDFLEMIALGMIGIRESDKRLVFSKPVGDPPDKEMEHKIDEKIKNTIPLIKNVFSNIISRQQNQQNL